MTTTVAQQEDFRDTIPLSGIVAIGGTKKKIFKVLFQLLTFKMCVCVYKNGVTDLKIFPADQGASCTLSWWSRRQLLHQFSDALFILTCSMLWSSQEQPGEEAGGQICLFKIIIIIIVPTNTVMTSYLKALSPDRLIRRLILALSKWLKIT